MSLSNLPPGVTDRMIDDHFGDGDEEPKCGCGPFGACSVCASEEDLAEIAAEREAELRADRAVDEWP